MSGLGSVADLKAAYDLLQQAVGLRHALVLSQVFEPGVRQKCFNEAPLPRGILEHTPIIGAVPAALACALPERAQKRFPVLWIDVVLDRDQYGSAVRLDRM